MRKVLYPCELQIKQGGEREEGKYGVMSPSLLPSHATRREGVQQAALSHPR